jgi:hypothetical protein
VSGRAPDAYGGTKEQLLGVVDVATQSWPEKASKRRICGVLDRSGEHIVPEAVLEALADPCVTIISSRQASIGGSTSGAGKQIVANQGYGLEAAGGCSGTLVQSNLIAANPMGNVNLTKSRGVTYIRGTGCRWMPVSRHGGRPG